LNINPSISCPRLEGKFVLKKKAFFRFFLFCFLFFVFNCSKVRKKKMPQNERYCLIWIYCLRGKGNVCPQHIRAYIHIYRYPQHGSLKPKNIDLPTYEITLCNNHAGDKHFQVASCADAEKLFSRFFLQTSRTSGPMSSTGDKEEAFRKSFLRLLQAISNGIEMIS